MSNIKGFTASVRSIFMVLIYGYYKGGRMNDKKIHKEGQDWIDCIISDEATKMCNKCGMILPIEDFRVVKGPTHTNILFDIVIPYKFKMELNEILAIVKEKIDDGITTYYFVVEVDRNYVKID